MLRRAGVQPVALGDGIDPRDMVGRDQVGEAQTFRRLRVVADHNRIATDIDQRQ